MADLMDHASCIQQAAHAQHLEPDALIRFDLLDHGWGCSITPADLHFAGTTLVEVYGQGPDPLSAITDAVHQLERLERRPQLALV